MARPIFEIFKGNDRQHYWRLKAPNGEIIAASEGYSSKQMAEHGITSVKHNAALAETEMVEDKSNTIIITEEEVSAILNPKPLTPYMGPLPTMDDE